LVNAGYNVATYTSPYFLKFNERILYNLKPISDNDLLNSLNDILLFHSTYNEPLLSFFDLVTLMAFSYFSRLKCDYIVVEVGLGGLLDSTNILNYDVSVITNIGYDHMEILGNTLEEIAYNKLGILKENNYLITGVSNELINYFNDSLKGKNININFYNSDQYKIINEFPLSFIYNEELFTLNLLGNYQVQNAILAIETIKYINPQISINKIKEGLLKTVWEGRFEKINNNLYIDGAHNIHGINALVNSINSAFINKKVGIVFSALKDKQIELMLNALDKYDICLTDFLDSRFEPLINYTNENRKYISNPIQAIEYMLHNNDIVFVCGSLHFLGSIYNNIISNFS
jgi:dihydrofolate synthase/folylpolyglutamate synthase